MAKELSSEVRQALEDIYYNVRTGRGKEAFALLEKASAAGDGDASCVLARCLCGYQYVWGWHGFPEDDARATKLLHKSVEQGSALGVLVALRSGELTPSVQKKMPFESLQAAFDEVEALAEGGDAFCQYVIGNSYFWWDFLRIQNKGKDSFPNEAAFKAYLKEQISKCEDWFWKAFRGGIYLAANNLNKYYTEGDEDIIAPQPEKARDLWKIGAELGYPTHQYIYAEELEKAGHYEEALHWYKESAEANNGVSWYKVGTFYFEGMGARPTQWSASERSLSETPTKSAPTTPWARRITTVRASPRTMPRRMPTSIGPPSSEGATTGAPFIWPAAVSTAGARPKTTAGPGNIWTRSTGRTGRSTTCGGISAATAWADCRRTFPRVWPTCKNPAPPRQRRSCCTTRSRSLANGAVGNELAGVFLTRS